MESSPFAMTDQEVFELFRRTGVLRMATVTPRGPLMRTMDCAVVDGTLCFHGGDRGEKLDLLEQEVVASTDETVAHLPSWFFDERRACPATTYYRSAVLRGRVERVEVPAEKAAILRALMERHQPEGRYQDLVAHDPLYTAVIDKLLVARFRPTSISGKAKLGQHKGPRTIAKAVAGLWQRGEPGDLAAIRAILEAHPRALPPQWMLGPEGSVFEVSPGERELEAAVELVRDEYWNVGVEPWRIRDAHRSSAAWVVARDAAGRVVATARAMSDDAKAAWIYDVAVSRTVRARGVGQALMALLLDHPRVRRARRVVLRTRDAHGFYAKFGFGHETGRNDLLAVIRT
ncbi:MAG: GNAT family N-acetyltransferase [Myxococcota bacterium]